MRRTRFSSRDKKNEEPLRRLPGYQQCTSKYQVLACRACAQLQDITRLQTPPKRLHSTAGRAAYRWKQGGREFPLRLHRNWQTPLTSPLKLRLGLSLFHSVLSIKHRFLLGGACRFCRGLSLDRASFS